MLGTIFNFFKTKGTALAKAWKAAKTLEKINMVFMAVTAVVGVKGFLQARQMLAKGQDIMANKTAAGGKIPIIYGTRRVGAQIVYMDTAQNRSKDLFVVYAISVGECSEIVPSSIEIDGNSILDGNIYKGGGYVGSDRNGQTGYSHHQPLNTASQVGDNQYSNAGTLGTNPALRYSFVFNLHHGASSQTADPMLRASIPTEWTTNHKLNGICYLACSFDYDKKGMYKGVPQITVQVKGKKVYDPRTDTTVWSSNPALCFLDYIQNDEYGKGLATSQINMTTISAAANKCDTLVDQPYYNGSYQDVTWSGDSGDDFIVIDGNANWWQNKVDEVIDIRDANDAVIFDGVDIKGSTRYEFYDATQENRLYIDGTLSNSYSNEAGSAKAQVKRFHCNGYIDTNKNVMDNAKELLANMRGIFNYVNGKYELEIEDTGSSTFSITDDHIIADAGISVDYGNKDKKANKVVVEFFNANKKYELDTATVLHDASPDYYSDDGEVLEIKAEFPYVTDPYIAYNMGKAILTRSRNQTTMQFLGTPEMYKLNVGDIVDLTYSGLGFSGKVCRVEALELQANGLVSVSLIEYFDVYTWEVPAQESVEILAKIPTIGALKPPQASSIVFTDTDASSINRPTLTWTEPTDFPVRQYRVDVVDSSDNNVFSKIVDTPSVDLAFLPKASNYEASITAFNGVGIESNASTKTFTIADDPVKTTEVEMNGVTMSTVETYGNVTGKLGNWVKFLNKTNFGEVVEFDNGLIVDSGVARFENAPTFVDGFTGQGTFNISQGSIQFGSYTPSTTTNRLYNAGGSLYWNGQALGTGTGDITAVVAGTNLNGGGTSGSVTLNLDSTITGDHIFSNNIIIQGNLTVQGTTTSVNTDDLNVKDKNITLNYSTGDSSASANGAGITIQDAVSATQDATLTWNTANDSFNFSHNLNFADNVKAQFGAGNDLQIYHDGSNSNYIKSTTSDIYLRNEGDNDKIYIQATNSGTLANYLTIDGSSNDIKVHKNLHASDNVKALFGAGSDLQIYHDGSNSHIKNTGTGSLYIAAEGTGDLFLRGEDDIFIQPQGGENGIVVQGNGAVTLYYDNSAKLATTSQGIDVTGSITTDGMTTSADINFGDDNKALFGAGNDLKIYHSANNQSYIHEVGTGNLKILADNLLLQRADESQTYIQALTGGAVDLRHAGNVKLATTSTGIDVTGTTVTDGLTTNGASEGDTYFTGGTANSRLLNIFTSTGGSSANAGHNFKIASGEGEFIFGNNTTTNLLTVKTGGIDVTGTVTSDGLILDDNTSLYSTDATLSKYSSSNGVYLNGNIGGWLRLNGDRTGNQRWDIYGNNGGGYARLLTNNKNRLDVANNGDISFYDDTGSSQSFFWDASAEKLAIGTTTANAALTVHHALPSGQPIAEFRSTGNSNATIDLRADGTGDSRIWFDLNGVTPFAIGVDNSDGDKFKISGNYQLGTNDRFVIDSSGNSTFSGTISSGSVTAGSSGNSAFLRAYYGSAYMTLQGYGLEMNRASSYIRPTTDGNKTLYIGGADASLDWAVIHFRSLLGLYMTGTQFLTTDRNLVNIGTISSGAITATGLEIDNEYTLPSSSGSAGQVLKYPSTGSQVIWADDDTQGTTINNNADNRIITGSGTANTLNAEANFTYDGSKIITTSNSALGTTFTLANTNGGGGREFTLLSNATGNFYIYDDTADATRFEMNSSGYAKFHSGINVVSDISINATQVITSSRNLVNIGTISSGAITSSSTVTGQKLVSTDGVLELDDNGTHNGIINVPASLRINIDSDNNNTGESFQIGNNVTNISGSNVLFKVEESGNLLVGTTSTVVGSATSGKGFRVDGANGIVQSAASGNVSAIFNRTSSDGDIVSLRKNGTQIAAIGVIHGNNLFIGGTSHSGLQFGSSIIYPTGGTGSANDATLDLGAVAQRFKDLHLSGQAYASYFRPTPSSADFINFSSGNIRFATGSSEKARLDTSGRLLVNDTSTSFNDKLYVNSDGYSTGGWRVGTSTTYVGKMYNNAGKLAFETDGSRDIMFGNSTNTDIMFIDTSAQSVGIGTTSPSHKLTIEGTTSSTTTRVKTTTGSAIFRVSTNNSDFAIIGQGGSNRLDVYDNNGSATRLSLDSSGNFLVGKTSTSYAVEGIALRADNTGVMSTVTDNFCFVANRLNSDGTLMLFAKDTSTVGSIGTQGSVIRVGSGNNNLGFFATRLQPLNSSGVGVDGTIDLGYSTSRFKDLYLTGAANASFLNIKSGTSIVGTITTSSSSLALNARNTGIMLFQSGGVEKARMDSAGRFGIGTSSPSEKLEIASNASVNMKLNNTGQNISLEIGAQASAARITAGSGDRLGLGAGNTQDILNIASGGSVGIGTTSPSSALEVNNASAGATVATFEGNYSGSGDVKLASFERVGGAVAAAMEYNDATTDMEFGTTTSHNFSLKTADTRRLTITSGGSVGINTTSPSSALHIGNAGHILLERGGELRSKDTGGAVKTIVRVNSSNELQYGWSSAGAVTFMGGGSYTERMRIHTNGNIGIKNSNPTATLTVGALSSGQTGNVVINNEGGNTATLEVLSRTNRSILKVADNDTTGFISAENGLFSIGRNSGNNSANINIDSSNRVGIGTNSPAHKLTLAGGNFVLDNAYGVHFGDGNTGMSGRGSADIESHVAWRTNGSERARIDSSGRLIVGGTTAGETGATTIYPNGNIASASITATGDGVFNFYKTETYNPVITANDSQSDTGQIIAVQIGGTTKGNIGISSATGNDMYIASGTTSSAGVGLRFLSYQSAQYASPCRGDGSTLDNVMDLGSIGTRFDDIYATNGTIQTSDRKEKQDIQALTDAEQRVATACKGLIRRFRWQDAVEEKGDDARYHFGVIAQDLEDAFEAEGLDAGDYGMFISSTWTDDGNEKTRLGVRYNELLAFIITTI